MMDLCPDWVDDVVVDRACRGKPTGRVLHKAERWAVARRMAQEGKSYNDIQVACGLKWEDLTRAAKGTT